MGRKKNQPPPSFATSRGWNSHYSVLFDDMLDSPAFIALTPHAQIAYIRILQEYKGVYTGNKLVCTYSTFEKKGFRRNTVSKAICMLVHFGFITYESGGLEHQPNIYHLSDGWKKIKTKEDVDRTMQEFKEEMNLRKRASNQEVELNVQ
jgi:hypothetical protein